MKNPRLLMPDLPLTRNLPPTSPGPAHSYLSASSQRHLSVISRPAASCFAPCKVAAHVIQMNPLPLLGACLLDVDSATLHLFASHHEKNDEFASGLVTRISVSIFRTSPSSATGTFELTPRCGRPRAQFGPVQTRAYTTDTDARPGSRYRPYGRRRTHARAHTPEGRSSQ